ncbi:MAG TPA: glycoside hydrolase family 3 N-terminal domain-containing protein [Rhodoblastus sp.]|nr:glycoside hydrolase family 3 N-terminal domain-containing protein [Rhodoblastus sp.]
MRLWSATCCGRRGGGALLALSYFVDDPYVASLRDYLPVSILVLSGVGIGLASYVGATARSRRWSGRGLLTLWCAVPLSLGAVKASAWLTAQEVMSAPVKQARTYGRHFIVGYWRVEEVEPLVAKGLVGGVFITRHNISGGAEALRAEIAHLQELRWQADLPPLIVATDQEGGLVSHLSPPLVAWPPLAELAGLPQSERESKAQAQGEAVGAELAALGVTLDFAPVVDLRSNLNNEIEQRAIASDPAVVAAIATAFAKGLEAKGVEATLKHFPGLGRIAEDTHHFRAHLKATPEDLAGSDWLPFRKSLAGTNSALMVGHVVVDALDPERPASQSKPVVDGLLREKWGFGGLIVTDDLNMGAVFHHDLCSGVVASLNAGVDLLLVSYDGRQYYPMMRCVLAADAKGAIDQPAMQRSARRLP